MSTVQDIAEEFLLNTRKSLKNREKLLRKSLRDIESISHAEIEKVVQDVFQNDQFLKAQLELSSEYKRRKFVQQNMTYVGPKEVVLNPEEVGKGMKKEVLHYVPIDETIKNLLEDPSFNKMLAMKPVNRAAGNKLVDVKDGSVYRHSDFFQQNPEAFSIIMYSDAVELKGRHQIVKPAYLGT